MIFISLLAITLATLLYVCLPITKESYWHYINIKRLKELSEIKTTALAAIADIEKEYQMGKITKQEYLMLKEQFKKEVIPVLLQEKNLFSDTFVLNKKNIEVDETIRKNIIMEVLRSCGKRFIS